MKDKDINRKKWSIVFFSMFFGLFMGFLAYNFVPESDYDLVRQWKVMDRFESVDTIEEFAKTAKTIDREIIPQIYSFIIAKTSNHNLLQFFVVVVGYAILCYILLDCKNRDKLSNGKFIMIFILAVLGQPMLYYFSGLYNYVAINLFALAVYFDYIKNHKKIAWIIYATSPFIHSSMLLPLLLILVLKIFKEGVGGKFLVVFTLFLLLSGPIMSSIIDIINVDFLNNIKNTYDSYILANDQMIKYYDGFYLFMSITKIGIAIVACWLRRGDNTTKNIRSLVYLTVDTVIILSLSSIAMTRFSSLVLFISLPLIVDVMSEKNRKTQVLSMAISALAIFYLVYTIIQMSPLIKIGSM